MRVSVFFSFCSLILIIWSGFVFSKPADAKKTEKSCVYCHVEYGSKELTEAGKYYKKNGSLAGYKEKSPSKTE
jgi:hypothetical protein